jgi:hypothetical protein
MEVKIALVSGSAILPSLLIVLASVSSPMNSFVALLKARALITCLNTNLLNVLIDYN